MRVAKMPLWQREMFKIARMLHTYVATALFGLLFMFCLSGLILNHPDWLPPHTQVQSQQTPLPAIVRASLGQAHQAGEDWQPTLVGVHSYLQQQFNLTQPDSIEANADDGLLMLEYKLPGSFVSIEIDMNSNQIRVEQEQLSLLQTLNNLHMGRYSGAIWSWIIDISAVLMLLFAITGMIILWQNRKYRRSGLILAGLGLASPLLVYLLFVPHLLMR